MNGLRDMNDLQALMARIRQANGGDAWDGCRNIVCEGIIAAGGLSGPYSQSIQLESRGVLASYQLGPAKTERGFDGSLAWTRSASGEVTVQDSQAGRHAGLTDAYLSTRGYLFPERWPAQLEWRGEEQENGVGYLLVQATPIGGQPVILCFDASSLLLDRAVQQIAGKPSVKRFSDYRLQQGLWLPYRMVSGTGDARFDIVTDLSGVHLNRLMSAELVAIPTQVFDDLRFSDGSWHASVTMEITNNHLYLSASVEGHSLSFMLDTGGVNLITADAADRIGLVCEGLGGRQPDPAGCAVATGGGRLSAGAGAAAMAAPRDSGAGFAIHRARRRLVSIRRVLQAASCTGSPAI